MRENSNLSEQDDTYSEHSQEQRSNSKRHERMRDQHEDIMIENPPKKKRTRWGQAPASSSLTPSSGEITEKSANVDSVKMGTPLSKIDFEARAAAARAALDQFKASASPFTSAVGAPTASGLTVLNQAGVLHAAGVSVPAAGMTLALQQQLMLMQKLREDRQQSVNSILESLKGRLPFALKTGLGASGDDSRSAAQKFDDVGRLIDEHGNVVPLPKAKYATLKINKALLEGPSGGSGAASNVAGDSKRVLYKSNKHSLKNLSDPVQNPYFDAALKTSANKVKKTGLRFVESGFYIRRQQNLERKQRRNEHDTLESLPIGNSLEEDRIVKARQLAEQFVRGSQPGQRRKHAEDNLFNAGRFGARKGDGADEGEMSTIVSRQAAVPLQRKREDTFPEMEWWDLQLVERTHIQEVIVSKPRRKEGKTGWGDVENVTKRESSGLSISDDASFPFPIKEKAISHLVEHPVPIEATIEKDPSKITLAMFLTEKERKKMRRQKRREREQEKQDKIRMGLIPPDPPKVKLSNLMRVLGEEVVANPTRIEQKVRKQVAERAEGHEARNAARKLNAERKLEKTRNKWIQKDEISVHVNVIVFSLMDITDKKCLYKINKNAQQLYLTGAAVLCPGIGNLVVAEGGPRAIKKYKGLMNRRIKWIDEHVQSSKSRGDENNDVNPFCTVVWEGPVKERVFKSWQIISCTSEDEAIVGLQELRAEHYWAMIKRFRHKNIDILSTAIISA